jgi:hypothetical protein
LSGIAPFKCTVLPRALRVIVWCACSLAA